MNGRVAYLVSRFPHLTETFIVNEIVALQSRGLVVDLYALVHHRDEVVQPDAALLETSAVYGSELGVPAALAAQLYWIRRSPRRWARVWWRALVGNRRSWPFLLRAVAVVPIAMAFARRIEADGVARVHAHWATHPALAAYAISTLTDIDYSVTVHAHDLYVDQSMLGEKLAAATEVVTVSEYNRRLLLELWPELAPRIHVVRCGVHADRWAPVAGTAQVAREVPLVLAVGSLESYKGHIHLIEACALLRAEGIAHRCVIVGRGELEDELRMLIASLHLDGTLELAGPMTSEAVKSLMCDADVFVQPSVVTADGKAEGVPVAIMEAMASGLPTVATDVTGMQELVVPGITGLLVRPEDPAAIAEAIAAILSDPALAAEFGSSGRRHVRAAFDLDDSIDALVEILVEAGPRS